MYKTTKIKELNVFKTELRDETLGHVILKSSCPRCKNVNSTFVCVDGLSDTAFTAQNVVFECAGCDKTYEIKIKLDIIFLGYA